MTIQSLIQHFKIALQNTHEERERQHIIYWCLEKVLSKRKIDLLLEPQQAVTPTQWQDCENIIVRLQKEEPIQYILEEAYFYDLKLKVNESVLIPRPETEELVEWILETLTLPNPMILDIGTGSACIPLALKSQCKGASVHAIEVSESALKVAQSNAESLELSIQFYQQDILNPSAWAIHPTYDVIVSNPPYIPLMEATKMTQRVIDFEPALALFTPNDDPLIFYKTIGDFAQQHLKKEGQLFFEIHEEYGSELVELLQEIGFQSIQLKKDLQNKDRMIQCRR